MYGNRPTEVYGENGFKLFKNINPGDIKQGYWGDCYFLSAISSIAEYPERIEKIFETKELNSPGIYSVTLYITGEKRTVTVDDYFPFCPSKDDWAFSKSVDQEIWVLILEKAWAKVHGSYQRIEGGNTAEALMALTGAYVDYIFHDQIVNKDVLWSKIFNSDQLKYIIATAASSAKVGKNKDDMKNSGIIDSHAYSLLEVTPLITDQKIKVRLLKLRNPWGFEEWKGAWSDSDNNNWTDDLKQKLNYEAKDDGVFFIEFEDYLAYYYNSTIWKYQSNEIFYYFNATDTVKEYAVFKFNIKKSKLKTKLFLAVNQLNSRFKNKDENFEYAPLKVIIAKIAGDQLKFVDGDAVQFCSVQLELEDLPTGKYIVFCKPQWEFYHHCRNLVWSININQETSIKRIYYKKFTSEIVKTMEEWLNDRLLQGKDYQRQQLEEDDNFNDEEEKDDDVESPNKENVSGIK